jgi:hypothetical protein
MPDKPLLRREEQAVVDALSEAWNRFVALEQLHDDHVTEFRHGTHELQYMIMARPVQRQYNAQL